MPKHSLLFRLLRFYGSGLPYHPGKGRLHQWLLRRFGLQVDEDFDVVWGGRRWRLNPADFVHADVFWLGRKEHYDLYHLRRLLQPGHAFLDVGANFGYYSIMLASRLTPGGVISAERIARLLDELGYVLFVSHRRSLRPLRQLPEGGAQMNVFCLPRTEDLALSSKLQ